MTERNKNRYLSESTKWGKKYNVSLDHGTELIFHYLGYFLIPSPLPLFSADTEV